MKVRDHYFITRPYIGLLWNNCNLRCINTSFILVTIHNLSNYDTHFMVKELENISREIMLCQIANKTIFQSQNIVVK